MNMEEVSKKIVSMKKNGAVDTNIFPGCVSAELEFDLLESEQAIVFWVPERFRIRCFYAASDTEELKELLLQVPTGTVLEYIYRIEGEHPKREMFESSGFELYDTYVRETTTYKSNPYEEEEKGKRKLLQKMYEPDFGEYAKMEDAQELFELNCSTFDSNSDDVFTLEEWEKIIEGNQCVIYREEGSILAYFVFREEGKKLYSNSSINQGPANILYNLERRIFEYYWTKGIRIFYAWYNVKNKYALLRKFRGDEGSIQLRTFLYDDIYQKK